MILIGPFGFRFLVGLLQGHFGRLILIVFFWIFDWSFSILEFLSILVELLEHRLGLWLGLVLWTCDWPFGLLDSV